MPNPGVTEYSEFDRGRILAYHDAGLNYPQIAEKTDLSLSGVWKTVQRYRKYKTYKSLPRSGRPPAISSWTNREIIRTLRKHRFDSYKTIAELIGGDVTWTRVRYIAAQHGYHRRVARRKPYMPKPTAKKRLKWAKDNTERDWNSVAWTDEAIFETGERSGRKMVTRRPGEENLPTTIVPTFRSGRKTLIVSAVIAHGRKGPITRVVPAAKQAKGSARRSAGGMTGEDYVEQVLEGPLIKFYRHLEKERGRYIYLVEDGSGPHRRKSTQAARDRLGIKSLPHPPSSPDLNPIEPLWALLKKRVGDIPESKNSLDALWDAIQKVWNSITDKEVAKYTSKMDERVREVKKVKGYQTEF
ncbi:Transposable element Tc1 transposase [Ceratobasidium sp. AG-Ba]|nr:Transposable element Tc1 transposase [Ceratobasidium sp. AG-Ba]QRW06783.1 Transposable element Tc1 transposase [Ceratobasidium sp. AG-Ba]